MAWKAQILAGTAAAAVACGAAAWLLLRRRVSPEALERKRRLALHTTGRIGDAMITGASADALFYTYTIRGVQYMASQEVGCFGDRLPRDLEKLVGPAGIKYSARNPANSILICEEWSGLRAATPGGSPAASVNDDAVGHQPQDSAAAQRP